MPTIEISDDERDDIDEFEKCGSHEDQKKELHCEDCDQKICAKDFKHRGHEVVSEDEHMQHFELAR